MGEAALAFEGQASPRIIKISSKRQITIPADMYEKSGFSDYAYVVWNEDGSIAITPIDIRNEGSSVIILRSLLAQGLDGEALIDEYERIIHPVLNFKAAIEQGMKDVEEGRVKSFAETQARLRDKYEL